ncbi:MarR family winged helix-turn-helix transcriptional regulator [Planctomycetota bacterium]
MSQQVPTTRYDLRVLQALRQIIRAVDLHSRQLLRQHKITGPQLIILLTVEKYELVTVSELAGHIHLSPSTVIGILDRLETKGFIRRERDPRDRRLVQVSLTEQGKVLASNAPSPLQGTLAEAMDKLPETELLLIAESLERIVGLMQVQHVDAAPILETGPINPVLGDTDA